MKLQIQCISEVKGFTVGNTYNVLENGANTLSTINDFGNLITFKKVEGNDDFKNYFTLIA